MNLESNHRYSDTSSMFSFCEKHTWWWICWTSKAELEDRLKEVRAWGSIFVERCTDGVWDSKSWCEVCIRIIFFSDLSLTAEELRLTVEIFVLCSLFLIQVGLFAQLLWISSISILPSSMVGSSGYDTSL